MYVSVIIIIYTCKINLGCNHNEAMRCNMLEEMLVEVVLEEETMQEHGDGVCPCILGSNNQDRDWRCWDCIVIHPNQLDRKLAWPEHRGDRLKNLGAGDLDLSCCCHLPLKLRASTLQQELALSWWR